MNIRGVQRADREPLLDLLELCFGERALFERYMDFDPSFRWSDFVVAEAAGQLVGCVQQFRKTLRLLDRVVALGGVGSVATHPDYRGRGVARKLVREREEKMRAAGIGLGLLFTDVPAVYAGLGWVSIPLRQFLLSFDDGKSPSELCSRPFDPDDLEAVRALFDAYASRFEGAIVRDASYWAGQLRYAGTPDEDFRVIVTRGQIAAYSRTARFDLGTVIMEHAYRPGAAELLCGLFREQLGGEPALLRLQVDDELETALRAASARFERRDDPSPMWRVLSRPLLESLLGAPAADLSDEALLRRLIHDSGVHYWTSDRF